MYIIVKKYSEPKCLYKLNNNNFKNVCCKILIQC